jgi:biopolymer transport protein ExbD
MARSRRRQNLTPMIDVIFLLLVFFMLAARFGAEDALPLQTATAAGAAVYNGPPRLIDIGPQQLRLNGQAVAAPDLAERLAPLVSDPADAILLRAGDGAGLQDLLRVMDGLRAAGFVTLVLVE